MKTLLDLAKELRDNPPTFDNIAEGDNTPEYRRHAVYGWQRALNTLINQYQSLPELSEEGVNDAQHPAQRPTD